MKFQALLEAAPYMGAPSDARKSQILAHFQNVAASSPSGYKASNFYEEPLPGGLVRAVTLLDYEAVDPSENLHSNVVFHATSVLERLGYYAVRVVVQEVVDQVAAGVAAGAALGLGTSLTLKQTDQVHLLAAALGGLVGGLIGNLIAQQRPVLVGNRVLGSWRFEKVLEGVAVPSA